MTPQKMIIIILQKHTIPTRILAILMKVGWFLSTESVCGS